MWIHEQDALRMVKQRVKEAERAAAQARDVRLAAGVAPWGAGSPASWSRPSRLWNHATRRGIHGPSGHPLGVRPP